jgi:hypothetical protein
MRSSKVSYRLTRRPISVKTNTEIPPIQGFASQGFIVSRCENGLTEQALAAGLILCATISQTCDLVARSDQPASLDSKEEDESFV